MSWHQPPEDGAWRSVHLAYLAGMGQRAWLHCSQCGHEDTVPPADLAERHGLPMTLPLLAIARRLVCSRCGARKAQCWPEPCALPAKTIDEVP